MISNELIISVLLSGGVNFVAHFNVIAVNNTGVILGLLLVL